MDLKSLLNQALKSDLLKQGADALGKQTNNIKSSSNSSSLKMLGAGAVGGGLIGMLMGSKKSKKMTKKIGSGALKVGGAAALGALAYKVYNDWQAKQSGQGVHETFDPDDSKHSVLILKAMIGAAKADGHVDEEEMARIEQALVDMGADEHVRQLVQQELNKSLDPAEIANQATSPQQASEIYLASLIVADEQNFMEKAYLQELAKQLQLSPEVTQQLEVQMQ
ncbi:tellurite resistance TerB family protein [Vibrio chemaguriensis]|uniref:Tellurite resistance TerB family protein n=1 Tax=Vibrio chemaguriensis TaxID=2527672 RepID=A0ABX1HS75_9VIBR|nr:tellurite resistance TerB family protein [Vibrio chemaguriensis]NKJ66308.1 tellurite resistance TerB family protein [Vibrio chemaguriensis]